MEPFRGDGVSVKEGQFLDGIRLDLQVVERLAGRRANERISYLQRTEILRFPPAELVGQVQPVEETLEFAQVVPARLLRERHFAV